MRHLIFALLTYLAAVVETTSAGNFLRVDTLGLLAAVILLTQRSQTATVWLLVIGMVTDTIGAETALGTHALIYIVTGFTMRTLVSQLHERPVHVLCIVGLCFLGAALTAIAFTRHHALSLSPDWSAVGMTVATTWLCLVLTVSSIRGILWLARRFRQPSISGGAMGTPVGLSVN